MDRRQICRWDHIPTYSPLPFQGGHVYKRLHFSLGYLDIQQHLHLLIPQCNDENKASGHLHSISRVFEKLI